MNEPLVSVIIPVYNHARYVRQCLDSLLTEGWPNLEVLMIDDGSSDNSAEVVQEWQKEHEKALARFEFIKRGNQGLTHTLNQLIKLSRGQFVKLLASDDYLLPGGIRAGVTALCQYPNWLAVMGDCLVVDNNDKQLASSGISQLYPRSVRLHVLANPKLIASELILRWSILGPVLLVRAETYNDSKGIGLYNENLAVEDRDFYLRLLSQNSLGYVPAVVATYRWHGQNTVLLSGERRKQMIRDLVYSAQSNTMAFKGLERFALHIEAERMQSEDWRTRGSIIYFMKGLMWRIVWQGLIFVQDIRVGLSKCKHFICARLK
jgi:glycosyltransferase involved in cell wall biosynthesis